MVCYNIAIRIGDIMIEEVKEKIDMKKRKLKTIIDYYNSSSRYKCKSELLREYFKTKMELDELIVIFDNVDGE